MEFTGERCIIGKTNKGIEKEHLNRYNFALEYVNDKVVLDIACGSGYGSKILSEKAKKVIGVDISEESINFAKQNFDSKKIKFFVGDVTNLNFIKNNSIDIVISFETIEHLEDYRRFLEEIKRILKKGGTAIISTPNKKFSSPGREKPINPYHVIEFLYEDFDKLLKEYFHNINFCGQTYMNSLKELEYKFVRLFPRKLRHLLIPKKTRDYYNSKEVGSIIDKDIERCSFFIAICKKS